MSDVTCRGTKADGSRCGSTIGLSDEGLCIQHDPKRQRLVEEGIQRSIETRAEKKAIRDAILPDGIPSGPPRTVDDCVKWSAWAMNAVALNVIPARTAECIAKCATTFLAGLKHRDQERELEELRQVVKELRKEAKR
jgi:hypothetical protein